MSCPVFAQSLPGNQAVSSILASPTDQSTVSVPEPTETAVRWYETGNVLWIVTQAWALAVLALLMFTGLSAKMAELGE